MTNCLLIPDELERTFENLGTGTKLTAGWCEEERSGNKIPSCK